MIIKSIETENFKRFASANAIFEEGLTGILGTNGTGKTSMVEMIFFALNGVSGRTINAEYIVSSVVKDGICKVNLLFEMGGVDYRVIRTFRKVKSTQHDASLYIVNGGTEKMVTTSVTATDAEIRKILGMGPMDLRYTIYSPQNEHRALMNLIPSKRKEWVLRMFGIDYLKIDSDEVLKGEVAKLTTEIAKLQGELDTISQRDPNCICTIEIEIGKIQSEISELIKSETLLESEIGTNTIHLEELNGLSERYTKAQTTYKMLVADIKSLDEKISGTNCEILKCVFDGDVKQLEAEVSGIANIRTKVNALTEKSFEIKSLESKHSMLSGQLKEYSGKLDKIKTELEVDNTTTKQMVLLENEIVTTLGNIPDGSDCCQETERRFNDLKSRISVLKSNIDALSATKVKKAKSLETIRTLGKDGECPFCMQRLGDHFTDVEVQILSEIQEGQNEIDEIGRRILGAQSELDAVSSLLKTVTEIRNLNKNASLHDSHVKTHLEISERISGIQNDISKVNSDIAGIDFDQKELDLQKELLSKAEKAQTRLSEAAKVLSMRSELISKLDLISTQRTEKATLLQGAKSELDSIIFDPSEIIRVSEIIKSAQSLLGDVKSKRAMLTERESGLISKQIEMEKTSARIEELHKIIDSKSGEVSIINTTRAELSNYILYLTEEVRMRVEHDASDIVNRVTSGKYQRVIVDPDFNILVQDLDTEYSVDRFSGGEQDVITIAIRLALSRFISDLHQIREGMPLFLDEVLSSLDEERRGNLLALLRSMEDWFPQIILIDHSSEVQGEFQHTMLVSGEGATSTIRQIS